MIERHRLIRRIAADIRSLSTASGGVWRVGIDGVDGAGKTRFADELAACVVDMEVIRASVDGFHNPRAVRYSKGRNSPEGFFEDSFNYVQLREYLLDPLSPGGSMRYRSRGFDHVSDRRVDGAVLEARPPSILIFDGIFLHRPELARYWDYSVFLDVSTHESLRRRIEREGVGGISNDPADPIHARYVRGQEIYLRSCDPIHHATLVVNNEDLEHPYVAA